MKKVKGRIRIDVRKCVNKIAKRREQVPHWVLCCGGWASGMCAALCLSD
jgi:hypothetical protein